MAGGIGSWAWPRPRQGRSSVRGQIQPPPSPSPFPPSSPGPMAIDLSSFGFGVTFHQGLSWDKMRLPQRFASIVDGKDAHHVLLRVSGSATNLWPAEVMFDDEGQMFLHNGWRRFVRSHAIEAGHFVDFKYNFHGEFSVKVFEKTTCCRHYHTDEDD
ncbi:hypothetical protein QYE76_027629 [Lolium multiflorum]|uniref:TF-B3 domain-containing protein n=1 Tax=Lolium multiflorum TaxID=4521 RepID=A0AAD8QKR0_LOLMU|nr:hypothetical protein QYE76_027629 [Lolium multiflorum]